MREISSKKKSELIAKAALAGKAKDVRSLDLRKLSSVCDYFIIASGDSTAQIDGIAANIEKELLKNGCKVRHREGKSGAPWVLLDCGDAVVHIFYRDTRGFYSLEKLWHDAPRRKWSESALKKKV